MMNVFTATEYTPMNSTVNVAGVERWASAIGGAALAAFGAKQLKDRSPAGAALAAAGSML
ncbi:MAG: cyclase, partial [Acidobacteria bacterium]|nr:cyclase [Acidobacteriota bacterium]